MIHVMFQTNCQRCDTTVFGSHEDSDEIAKLLNQELVKATLCRIKTPTVINPRSVTVR